MKWLGKMKTIYCVMLISTSIGITRMLLPNYINISHNFEKCLTMSALLTLSVNLSCLYMILSIRFK